MLKHAKGVRDGVPHGVVDEERGPCQGLVMVEVDQLELSDMIHCDYDEVDRKQVDMRNAVVVDHSECEHCEANFEQLDAVV